MASTRPAALVGAVALVGSYAAVRAGVADRVDDRARQIASRGASDSADRVVAVATDLGSVYGMSGVALALAVSGRRRAAADVLVAGGAAWCVAQGIKPLLVRDRPYELGAADRLVAPPAGSSWPSGHAAVAAAMAHVALPRASTRVRRMSWLVVLAVGLSRLRVGVHHLSDVVAGWGVGTLCASLWRRVRR